MSNITPGRPIVGNIIKAVVAKAGDSEKVAIAACGPQGLMKAVMRAAVGVMGVNGPSVELHCEAFGW
jgi:NAD(P)H-flavin reductase